MTDDRLPAAGSRDDAAARSDRFDGLLAEYLDRLNDGELLDPDDIAREHPDLAERIIAGLDAFLDLGVGDSRGDLGTIGDYTLRRQVGRGGMGVVYEAWQNSMDRLVALKVLPAGIAADSKAFIRFMREAKAAGKLRHPNIVGVHAIGVDQSTPYYAMEYVEGETLEGVLKRLRMDGGSDDSGGILQRISPLFGRNGRDRRDTGENAGSSRVGSSRGGVVGARGRSGSVRRTETAETSGEVVEAGSVPDPSSIPDANAEMLADSQRFAEVFAGAAEGLAHAHENGIVHRDIKPSNRILESNASGAEPSAAGQRLRIVDFGLARWEGQESLTVTGDFLGTVLYMSPEQAMARRIPIDHRTDIYSLGATMYEALTRRPPFQGRNHQDTLSHIVVSDPPPIRRLNPRVPRDLETVVLKCLRKDPADRYRTAGALARDLRRVASGEPVEARPQTAWERLSRRLWRYRTRVGVAALVLALASVSGYVVLTPEGMLNQKLWNVPEWLMASSVSADGRSVSYIDWRPGNLGVRNLASGTNRDLTGNVDWARPTGGTVEEAVISPDGQRVAFNWVHETVETKFDLRVINTDGSDLRILHDNPDEPWVRPLTWSPDGESFTAHVQQKLSGKSLLVSVLPDDGARRVLRSWPENRYPGRAAFSPDGLYLAFDLQQEREPTNDRDIFVIPLAGGEEIPVVSSPAHDQLIGWTPDGGSILFSSRRTASKSLWWIEVEAGAPAGTEKLLRRDFVGSPIGLAAEGTLHYGVSTSISDVYLGELDDTGERLLAKPRLVSSGFVGRTCAGAWSPDGTQLAYRAGAYSGGFWGPDDWSLVVLSVETGRERRLLSSPGFLPRTRMRGPRWTPDGGRLVVFGENADGVLGVHAVDVETGAMEVLAPADTTWRQVTLSPDGASMYYRVGWVTVFRLDFATGKSYAIQKLTADSVRLAVSPDGEWVASWRDGRTLAVFPSAGGEPRAMIPLERGSAGWRIVGWTPGGSGVFLAGPGRGVGRVDVETGKLTRILEGLGPLEGLNVHPDGRRVVFTVAQGGSELWVMKNFLPDG